MRTLVFGARGQVGFDLIRAFSLLGPVEGLDRDEVDLADTDGSRECVRSRAPDVVINAAAFTDVDGAESNESQARAINAEAPLTLAEETRAHDGFFVHYSTDFVFDGTKDQPYLESDTPNPLNVYGRTKQLGDEAVLRSGVRGLILRTGWVYSVRGRNFVRTILRLAAERDELSVVDDQVGAPTWSRTIAQATALMVYRRLHATASASCDVYNVSSAGQVSWCGFARKIVEVGSRCQSTALAKIVPTTSEAYGAKATRPPYSVLDHGSVKRDFGLVMPHWSSEIELAMAEMPWV